MKVVVEERELRQGTESATMTENGKYERASRAANGAEGSIHNGDPSYSGITILFSQYSRLRNSLERPHKNHDLLKKTKCVFYSTKFLQLRGFSQSNHGKCKANIATRGES